jgi:hypothetical protein
MNELTSFRLRGCSSEVGDCTGFLYQSAAVALGR